MSRAERGLGSEKYHEGYADAGQERSLLADLSGVVRAIGKAQRAVLVALWLTEWRASTQRDERDASAESSDVDAQDEYKRCTAFFRCKPLIMCDIGDYEISRTNAEPTKTS